MVLLGRNGVGKSNLLDCCALLMGTQQTRELVERRVPSDLEYDISVVLEGVRVTPDLDWWQSLESAGEESLADAAVRTAAAFGADEKLQSDIATACFGGVVRYRLALLERKQRWAAHPG